MNDSKANLVVTDPPSNVPIVGRTKDVLTIQNDDMEDGKFYDFLLSAFRVIVPHLAEGRICYTMEIDSHYATVIVGWFRSVFPSTKISVLRNGQELPYEAVLTT